MSKENNPGQAPLHETLRRRVEAVLPLPPGGFSHAASDTLQRAVNAVCGEGLSTEWADLFVTMAQYVEAGDDLPNRMFVLAKATRTLVDRVQKEPQPAAVLALFSDGVATKRAPLVIVKRLQRWIELPESRVVLRAYTDYVERCRRSRTSAVDVRGALTDLVFGQEDAARQPRATVLISTLQTANEVGLPPAELSLEIRELATFPLDPTASLADRHALDIDLIRRFREEGFAISHLFALNREHCSPSLVGGGARLRTWLPTLMEKGLTESRLMGLLLKAKYLPPGTVTYSVEAVPISPRTWDNFLQIEKAVQPLKFAGEALELIFSHFGQAIDLEKRSRTVREIVQACVVRPKLKLDDLRNAILHLNQRQDGHAATLAMAGLPSRMTSDEAMRFFQMYLADHPPFSHGSQEAQRYREKTYELIRRLHNISYGFTAMKVVNQRMPDGGPSAFDEFGDDLFEKLYVVNVSSNDLFPGYGVLFVGAQMERIFVHDRSHPTDPLHLYRTAWTDPARLRSIHLDLDRFADAEFAFVRGFLAVSVPEGDFASRYEVAGTHLTLMIWNQHFPGVEGELAMLVPTSIYRERVRPCIVRCKELDKPHPEVLDACRAGLDPVSLRAECEAKNLPFVDLGSPSVAGGGLVNGFPPKKPPFHEWEAKLQTYETRDRAGHIHKSHILGGYRTQLANDPELNRALQPLRDGNDLVFDIGSSCLNLLDIFFMCFATWHRGDTLDAIDFEDVFDEDEQQQLAEADEEDEPFNPRNTRILMTAYAVHDQLIEFRGKPSEFRIYCSANPLHLYPQPEATITLDTLDMKLVVRSVSGVREIDLARDKVGSLERAELIWVSQVLRYMRRTGFDMRPYDRVAVASLLPTSKG